MSMTILLEEQRRRERSSLVCLVCPRPTIPMAEEIGIMLPARTLFAVRWQAGCCFIALRRSRCRGLPSLVCDQCKDGQLSASLCGQDAPVCATEHVVEKQGDFPVIAPAHTHMVARIVAATRSNRNLGGVIVVIGWIYSACATVCVHNKRKRQPHPSWRNV